MTGIFGNSIESCFSEILYRSQSMGAVLCSACEFALADNPSNNSAVRTTHFVTEDSSNALIIPLLTGGQAKGQSETHSLPRICIFASFSFSLWYETHNCSLTGSHVGLVLTCSGNKTEACHKGRVVRTAAFGAVQEFRAVRSG